MALDSTVKVGPEWYIYFSKVGTVTIDPATRQATEGTLENAPDWKLIAFARHPITWSEPQVIVDVYDHFDIDHTKRGKQQRKTLSIKKAYTNMNESFRDYVKDEFLVKLECHPNDGDPNEAVYFTSVHILTPSWEIPEEEGVETIECIYAQSGSRDLTAA